MTFVLFVVVTPVTETTVQLVVAVHIASRSEALFFGTSTGRRNVSGVSLRLPASTVRTARAIRSASGRRNTTRSAKAQSSRIWSISGVVAAAARAA
jgi:hypothetical protein